MPRPAPVSFADVLDELRSAVESDGRSTAAIAAGLDPPMSRSQLAQILTGVKRAPSIETVVRIAAGVRPPRRVALIRSDRSGR